VLKSCELLKLNWPDWVNVALLTGSTSDRASNQVLIGVDHFMILEAEQCEEIYILLNQVDTSVVLNRAVEMLISRKQNSLSHQYLNDVEEGRVVVQLEIDIVEYLGFLSHKLVLSCVEPLCLTTIKDIK